MFKENIIDICLLVKKMLIFQQFAKIISLINAYN